MKLSHRTAVLGLGLLSILAVQGCAEHGEHWGHDKDENEVKIELKDCPAPVQATLTREAGGGQIGEVEKETRHGKLVYEADTMIGGKNYEIKVAEDGTLLAKKLDDEKEEKD